MFRQDFTCPAYLFQDFVPRTRFKYRGYHPVSPDFPDRSTRTAVR